MRIQNLLLLLGAILSLAHPGWGESSESVAQRCLSPLYKLSHPATDTAIELEMPNGPSLLSLFTTRNGEVGDFFLGQILPRPLMLRYPLLSDSQIRQLQWRLLNPWEKLSILKLASLEKPTLFSEDRKVPHLMYVDQFTFYLDKPVSFLGKDFSPGRHEMDPREFLKGPIEYIGPSNDPSGIEIHFRTNRPAGEVSRAARTFQEMLGEETTHQHAYVVVPIPQKSLEREPELIAFQNADFFRRANLAAEMMTLMEEDRSITKRETGSGNNLIRWFGWLDTSDLNFVYDYLLARGKLRPFKLGDQVKIGWIGFRGHDKFDEPNLMGMEVRAISQMSDPNITELFLNTLQKSWTEQQTGISLESLGAWLKKHSQKHPRQFLEEIWYHKEWSQILSEAPSQIRDHLAGWSYADKTSFLEAAPEETKMLFHNWANDPIFAGDRPGLHLLVREQTQALQTLSNGKRAYRQVVREFLLKSGLYERVLRSLKPE